MTPRTRHRGPHAAGSIAQAGVAEAEEATRELLDRALAFVASRDQ